MVWFVLFACKGVEPAPEDIDSLNRYLWRHFDDENGLALQEGIRNLHAIMDADNFEERIDGSISNLVQDDLAMVGKEDNDASLLSGVYFVSKVNCSIPGIEPNVYATNQDELHPDTYIRYSRTYTSDFDAYVNRETDRLTWDTTYEIEGFGYAYEASLSSGMRYVPAQSDGDHADMLITRTVLQEPAYFDEDSTDRGMFQDFQMELYYQLDSGDSFHLYAIWREMILFGDVSFESESAQRLVLDGLADWDTDMENNCR
ncbi:MAG: hypothetical protein VX278_24015 [Myxococcota bacterium]|nr:hypothetical protein [Myxococcota bacterium]